jgi:hypothetical protein
LREGHLAARRCIEERMDAGLLNLMLLFFLACNAATPPER